MLSPDLDNENDESLMVLVKCGDHQAFSILVKRHTNRFYGLGYRMLGNGAESEDVVQDTFLKIWQKPDIWKENSGAKFTTWFYRIIVNACNDVLRKRGRLVPDSMLGDFEDGKAGADENIEEFERQKAIEIALSELPQRQRVAIELCFYEGLKNKEAAEIMEINIKALESLLMRGKKSLKDILLREGLLLQGILIWMIMFY